MKISILVADGFTDSSLSIALDVFRAANAIARHNGRSEVGIAVASPRGGKVRSAAGLTVATDKPARADVVLVPGIWMEEVDTLEPTFARADVRALGEHAAKAHARGAFVGSACAGAFALADAGLLDGRACTTTWWLAPKLQQRRPATRVTAEHALVIEDRLVTAGAVFAQADLTLHVVARFLGPKTSQQCARFLLLDKHASQAPYMAVHQLSADDPTVRRAENWIQRHLAEDFAIDQLARGAGTSPRTLARRLHAVCGLSPIGFVQRLRVETAVRLLETTRLSLAEVAPRVGYRDAATLRRLVRREIGRTPRELRRRATAP